MQLFAVYILLKLVARTMEAHSVLVGCSTWHGSKQIVSISTRSLLTLSQATRVAWEKEAPKCNERGRLHSFFAHLHDDYELRPSRRPD